MKCFNSLTVGQKALRYKARAGHLDLRDHPAFSRECSNAGLTLNLLAHEVRQTLEAVAADRNSAANLFSTARRHAEDWIIDSDLAVDVVFSLEAYGLSEGL